MERTISREDRIKRAEELYYRRKNAVNVGIEGVESINFSIPCINSSFFY